MFVLISAFKCASLPPLNILSKVCEYAKKVSRSEPNLTIYRKSKLNSNGVFCYRVFYEHVSKWIHYNWN